jgi:hypothetical protein
VTRSKKNQEKTQDNEKEVLVVDPLDDMPSTYPKDFQSLVAAKITPYVPGYELITSDLQMVKSKHAMKRLTQWCLYEAKLVVALLVLTGMFVYICFARSERCVCVREGVVHDCAVFATHRHNM